MRVICSDATGGYVTTDLTDDSHQANKMGPYALSERRAPIQLQYPPCTLPLHVPRLPLHIAVARPSPSLAHCRCTSLAFPCTLPLHVRCLYARTITRAT